jgi:hypothetical protein
MTIWYILYSFGTFSQVLALCTKKNLAALQQIVSQKRSYRTSEVDRNKISAEGPFFWQVESFNGCLGKLRKFAETASE